MTTLELLGGLALAIWVYLVLCRGDFWRTAERDDRGRPIADPAVWPDVVAVVPARNEAEVIAASVASLMAQDYPGSFSVILVDDDSEDSTAEIARKAGEAMAGRLTVLGGAPMAKGWSGKLWAASQGILQADMLPQPPKYLLLTDADVVHAPDSVRHLVARAEAGRLVVTSLMVRLRCESWAERALIPAFVFFFRKLYPFAWVNRPDREIAAAGGCVLVQRRTLAAAGGLAAVRAAMVDDCALGALLKPIGPIWLGLTNRAWSLRPHLAPQDIRRMVGRSAFAQLNYSPVLLALAVVAMLLTYIVPPALTLLATGAAQWMAATAWALMTVAFLPILVFYRSSPLWALLLPAIASVYLAFTVGSAVQCSRGRGSMWKGRAQVVRATEQ